jgi:hypothetical protein
VVALGRFVLGGGIAGTTGLAGPGCGVVGSVGVGALAGAVGGIGGGVATTTGGAGATATGTTTVAVSGWEDGAA